MNRKWVFIIIAYALLLLGIGGQVLITTENLQGEVAVEENVFSAEGFWNGTWQAAFEDSFSNELKIREWLIPVRNQVMYSVFNKSPNKNIVIGKDRNLYEEEYVCFESQIYAPMTAENVNVLVEKLDTIDKALDAKNKHLFIFITPSKAEIYREDVPDKFNMIAPTEQQESTYSLFINALNQTDIAYYDSTEDVRAMKDNVEFRVFPKTGTHWSRVTGNMCAVRLADAMEEQLAINLPEITVSYQECEEPLHPDTDIFNSLNLLEKAEGPFYEPIVKVVDSDREELTILARGGSFMGQSLSCLTNNNFFENNYYLENTVVRRSEDSYAGTFNSYDELPIGEMIEKSDIIFLEVNEEAVNRMSFGFIDYLLDNGLVY